MVSLLKFPSGGSDYYSPKDVNLKTVVVAFASSPVGNSNSVAHHPSVPQCYFFLRIFTVNDCAFCSPYLMHR